MKRRAVALALILLGMQRAHRGGGPRQVYRSGQIAGLSYVHQIDGARAVRSEALRVSTLKLTSESRFTSQLRIRMKSPRVARAPICGRELSSIRSPDTLGEHVLFHVSEEPGTVEFNPRPSKYTQEPVRAR